MTHQQHRKENKKLCVSSSLTWSAAKRKKIHDKDDSVDYLTYTI